MSENVKPRAARTRATRRRIVTAASESFVANGYAATTLEEIARRADVAVQTVYFHFGNKRTVLKEAVDVAAVGDDEPVPVLDRPYAEQARTEQDPRRAIELWTAFGRQIMTRVGPIMRVVRDASAVDPDMAKQWNENREQTASAFRVLATQLDAMSALRVPVDEAVDILCALSGLEMYLVLTDRGWSPLQWERFVVDSLAHALLTTEHRQSL
ncbi:TetR/AcrR family transcriptional regulator [Amycolatopsis sp. Poz14]|uniref:TetR/AcrR family transcriptional regulator n=1 Tax=Amycolatopsis sp. Poz14 TaxID=1447705 RepID=UPI001EE96727|nr:TetR/AcrR family transcriptional regulator [Amycolatopsis sp. Poz14]